VVPQTYELFNDWASTLEPGANTSFRRSPFRVATRHRGYTHSVFTFLPMR
jgi:hypothetical protein